MLESHSRAGDPVGRTTREDAGHTDFLYCWPWVTLRVAVWLSWQENEGVHKGAHELGAETPGAQKGLLGGQEQLWGKEHRVWLSPGVCCGVLSQTPHVSDCHENHCPP